MAPRSGPLTALMTVGAVGAAAAAWGMGVERHLFTVRHHVVPVLSSGSDPIRVLHISDMHLAPWQTRRREWIANLASLRPDVVIDTGDNLGHPDAIPAVRSALAPFAGLPGVHVHGSNDIWSPRPRNPFRYFLGPSERTKAAPLLDTQGLDQVLEGELGWYGLNNEAVTLDVRGHRLRFLGTNDPHHDLEDWEALDASAMDAADGSLTIGVTHAPYRRILDGFGDRGADMIFAGHTHGGQVRVPGVGALVANCDIPLAQARGLSSWRHGAREIPLNVSAGLGHSVYAPVRFACRPEVSLLTLAPRP
ncbi:metallophosphoesterase [Microbacterium amylolyticum]|uniref:MPP superfamily phosphohydrolase n=1 Tax=Microbacterium amylolyticum TaxID=936337 RepID=A0ABS4ZJK7_9MICO|nr:metallophosphoesterase [Microbacterium amylolyticum]MBP2437473.1 putative MPP superfamily phosphohydrolase [Microbacterium amylolyticum]